jgi:hypothetical protein
VQASHRLTTQRTHALRIRWSRSDKYASYRRSPGSSIAFLLLFIAHLCSFPLGTGWMCLYGSGEAGIMNGRAPLGDAWLLAEANRNGILENLRYAYISVSCWHALRALPAAYLPFQARRVV